MTLSERDKRLIHLLQGDLPVTERPFARLAERVDMSEAEVMERIRAFQAAGLIRRFGATLFHQRSGYPVNVMVAWRVPEEEVEAVGRKLAEYRNVTHCYQRRTAPGWPFNLFCMVHGETATELTSAVARMAREAGVSDYKLLFSEEELKKTSMRYFA